MWKKSNKTRTEKRSVPVDVKQQVNNILLDTITTQLQIQDFKGKRGDEEFSCMQTKLMDYMIDLKKLEEICEGESETENVKHVEHTVKTSLCKLERKAAENDNFSLTTQMRHNILAKTQRTNRQSLDMFKSEKLIYQIQKEIHHIEIKLASDEYIQPMHADAIERKIVSLSEQLEKIEVGPSTDLQKTKTDLLKLLVRCSGKLKKARRRGSAPNVLSNRALSLSCDNMDIGLSTISEKAENTSSGRSFITAAFPGTAKREVSKEPDVSDGKERPTDFQEFINENLPFIDQILPSPTSDSSISDSTIDVKVKLETFLLSWADLTEHIYSEHVPVESLEEVVNSLQEINRDLYANIKQLKKYIVNKKKGTRDVIDVCKLEKEKIRELLKEIRVLKSKVCSFSGIYNDQSFREIKAQLENCLSKVEEVNGSGVARIEINKLKIKMKIIEYIDMLDERSSKV